jgi:hypothetical protein
MSTCGHWQVPVIEQHGLALFESGAIVPHPWPLRRADPDVPRQ